MARSLVAAAMLLLATYTAAHAGINDALECKLGHDAAFAAVRALPLTNTTPLAKYYMPGNARAFGLAPSRIYTVGDGESDVIFMGVHASFDSVLAAVLSGRHMQSCPENFGAANYCRFSADSIGASMVVQSDPEAKGFALVSCSYTLR